jgi:hypothetical protein
MGGGLLQLVAYGAQDAYITGNPHITFWKVLYKRHTNFAIESMRVNFTGAPAYGQRVVAVVNRNADLVWKTYVEVTLPDTRQNSATSATGLTYDIKWSGDSIRRLGYILLNKIEVEIGGQVIDRHYGEWLYLWENLTSNYDNSVKMDAMLGGALTNSTSAFNSCNSRPNVLYIPLQFWFNRNPGLALPLIALQYHEVRFNITLSPATDLVCKGSWNTLSQAAGALPDLRDMALYIDYVYLDVDERRRFAQDSHEYLIDQLQTSIPQTITSPQGRLDLTLNHPVKELIWVFQNVDRTDCSLPTSRPVDPNTSAQPDYVQKFIYDDIAERCRIQLNGQDRFDERFGDYFWKVQPYQHHTGGAFWPTRTAAGVDAELAFGYVNPVNVYSFAIQPEEHQPSGTCNFSRIDTATLVYDTYGSSTTGVSQVAPSKTTPFAFRIYAVNYNIFRIMSGMGGLAYSN